MKKIGVIGVFALFALLATSLSFAILEDQIKSNFNLRMYMKKAICLFLFGILMVSCASRDYINTRGMQGTISEGRYYSPGQRFSIGVIGSEYGSRVTDTCLGYRSGVSFLDDLGNLTRVEVTQNYKNLLEEVEIEPNAAFLGGFFEDYILSINDAFNGTTVIKEEERQLDKIGAAKLYILSIPQGSTLTNAITGVRADCVRGYIISFCDDQLVVISKQEGMFEDIGRKIGNGEALNEQLFGDLIEIRQDYRGECL